MTVKEGIHPIHRPDFLRWELHAAALALCPPYPNLRDAERAFNLGQFEIEREVHALFELTSGREAEVVEFCSADVLRCSMVRFLSGPLAAVCVALMV